MKLLCRGAKYNALRLILPRAELRRWKLVASTIEPKYRVVSCRQLPNGAVSIGDRAQLAAERACFAYKLAVNLTIVRPLMASAVERVNSARENRQTEALFKDAGSHNDFSRQNKTAVEQGWRVYASRWY